MARILIWIHVQLGDYFCWVYAAGNATYVKLADDCFRTQIFKMIVDLVSEDLYFILWLEALVHFSISFNLQIGNQNNDFI